jgi:hypothetical protein
MVGFILGQLAVLVVVWTTFIVLHVALADGRRGAVWWQLLSMAVVGLAEAGALLLVGTEHTLPMWVFVLVFGAMDVIAGWWVFLQWQARRVARPQEKTAALQTEAGEGTPWPPSG